MKTIITISNKRLIIPKKFRHNDDRFSETLVKYILEKYTKKGDKIFDPFAGLGTTLIVSEKLGRIPFGIELDKSRFNFIKTKLTNKTNIVCGSSLKLNKNKFPKFDFSLTSPPYNPINEQNYLSGKGGYRGFLKDIKKIYSQLKQYMKINSYVVIEVSNLKGKEVTALAWDIAKEVSKIFYFEGEIIVDWRNKRQHKPGGDYGYGYDHSYCLVFKNR
jgi:DNA modification methylase